MHDQLGEEESAMLRADLCRTCTEMRTDRRIILRLVRGHRESRIFSYKLSSKSEKLAHYMLNTLGPSDCIEEGIPWSPLTFRDILILL